MPLKLVYLARLRESLGRGSEEIALPGSVSDVGALLDVLRTRGGPWASELAAGRPVRIAVNHAMAGEATPVRDGDEVALFPPVTGG